MALAPDTDTTPRRDRGTSAHARWDRTETRTRRDHTWRWQYANTPAARLRAAISEVLAAVVAVHRASQPEVATGVTDHAAHVVHNLAQDIRAHAARTAR